MKQCAALALVLSFITAGCASGPAVGVGVGAASGGVGAGVTLGGGGRGTRDLNGAYKEFLGKLNPNDQNSVSQALDFYHRNFTPQAGFRAINNEGFRDFKRFYLDAIPRLIKRAEAEPEAKWVSKIDRYGLEYSKGENGIQVRPVSGFLKSQFKDYVSENLLDDNG